MSRKDLRELLHEKRLFFDGGMGTLLQERGLQAGELPETWNLSHPEELIAIHKAYLDAGCDIFNTNTFGANSLKYPDNLKEIVESGVKNAMEARRLAGREDNAYVALDIGPTGKLLQPMGDLAFEDAVSIFSEIVRYGAGAGADLVLIETMADAYEIKAAVLAAKENCDLPVFTTMVFDESGRTLTGGTPESMTALLEGLRVDALGINCSLGPVQMVPIVKRFLKVSSTPVIVNPNAGLPKSVDGKTVYDIDADTFASCMETFADLGAQGIGGCCGTTPEYIRKTIALCEDKPFAYPEDKNLSVVTSFAKSVEIGPVPVIIGERINPTGKKKFKDALKNDDMDYIVSQGLDEEDAGADVLDVNVGLPEIDEVDMIGRVIRELQEVTTLPLQIDTSDIAAMEHAMRIYNGKPMVNSVNGKEESMRQVFPLIAKYGGVVVALLLDEDGIPATSDRRLEIAEKICRTAQEYGISQKDIVFDALAMTVSSDSRSAMITLETLQKVRDRMHGHTILGVSNISFGLPRRELINAAFFTMAMQSGLSCAIINPNNEPMMNAYRSFKALYNEDPQCMEYIDAYKDTVAAKTTSVSKKASSGKTAASGPMTLGECIEKGLDRPAADTTRKAIFEDHVNGLDLVNQELIPALDRVGKGFEKGTLFLPQLLMSAEAAQAAFEVIKEAMKDAPQESAGKVILATVKGDIHDIGKNIVKVIMENYGYDVIDLGRDVDPELILKTAIDKNVTVVGLSALMTTTVVNMEETIKLLNKEKPDVKTIVGGAVMNQDYADQIGADYYAKDAMETVRYADQILGIKR